MSFFSFQMSDSIFTVGIHHREYVGGLPKKKSPGLTVGKKTNHYFSFFGGAKKLSFVIHCEPVFRQDPRNIEVYFFSNTFFQLKPSSANLSNLIWEFC